MPMPIKPWKLNQSNAKTQGSDVRSSDTVWGCANACKDCYARRCAMRDSGTFRPTLCNLTGRPIPGQVYRFGTMGDAATDWTHTHKQIQCKRTEGMNAYFIITKLQHYSEHARAHPLQVSLDPLTPKETQRTLRNLRRLLAKPHQPIMLRIKSIATSDPILIGRQTRYLAFARKHNLPVLETPWRTFRKTNLTQYNMLRFMYAWIKNNYRMLGSFLYTLPSGAYADIKVCDLRGEGCAACGICEAFGRQSVV